MVTRFALAIVCFLLALHEYFLGSLEGAQPSRDGIVMALLSGDFAAGPVLLVASGLFLIYRAWESYKDRRDRRSSVKRNA